MMKVWNHTYLNTPRSLGDTKGIGKTGKNDI